MLHQTSNKLKETYACCAELRLNFCDCGMELAGQFCILYMANSTSAHWHNLHQLNTALYDTIICH